MRRPTLPGLLRAGAFLFLALPLTGLLDRPPFSPPEYTLLIDESESMRKRFPTLFESIAGADFSIGGRPVPVVGVRSHAAPLGAAAGTREELTDLAAGIRAAAALLPRRADKRIVLVTDGLTEPAPARALTTAVAKERVRLYAMQPPSPERHSGIVGISAPPRVYLLEPFLIKGQVASSQPGQLLVVLRRDGVAVQEQAVSIESLGVGEVEFLQEGFRAGRHRYSLEIDDDDGPSMSAEVVVGGSPRLLFLASDPGAAEDLIALYRTTGIDIDVADPSRLPELTYGLDAYDVVLLDDLPAAALSATFADALRPAVAANGTGLIVIGGRKSLGSEDYRDTVIESMLPVAAGYESPPPPQSVSLVIAMDTSFSMYSRGRGLRTGGESVVPRKIDVAKQSAAEIVRVMRRQDQIGIIGNSTDLYWIQDLDRIDDREEVLDRISRVGAIGGGIDFFSIVRESYLSLRNDAAPVRHILIFCDAADIDQYEVLGEGHSFDLIRDMAEEGVTLSVLAIGNITDKDVPFLRTSSMIGQGDFYLVSNILALPRYFVSEYKKLTGGLFYEGEITTSAGDYSPLLAGIEGHLPAVQGIDTVSAREGSRSPVFTSYGTPLVTLGRYGKGRTAVFASDSGHRWAKDWIFGSLAERFWMQLLFSVAPPEEKEALGLILRPDRDRDRLNLYRLSAEDTAGFPDRLRVRYGTADGGGDAELVRTGARSYRSREPLPDPGFYNARILAGDGAPEPIAVMGLQVPPPMEELALPPDWALIDGLVKASAGRWIQELDEVDDTFYLDLERSRLYLFFVLCGVTLIFVEVIIKQLSWR